MGLYCPGIWGLQKNDWRYSEGFLSYKVGPEPMVINWSYGNLYFLAKNKHIKTRRGPAHPVVVSGVCWPIPTLVITGVIISPTQNNVHYFSRKKNWKFIANMGEYK